MSKNYSIGGQAVHYFYRVKLKTDGSAYDVLDALTDTVAGTPTLTNAAFKLTEVGASKPQYQEDGSVKVSFDNYTTEEGFWTFLDKVAKPTAAAITKPEVTKEDGTKKFTSATTGEQLIVISYYWPDDDATPADIFTHIAFGGISPTSGSFESKGDGYAMPTLEFTGAKTEADLAVALAMFDDDILSASPGTDITGVEIADGEGYWRKYCAKAA